MKILGLSFGYHDSTACLLVDGEITACTAEERFSRKKHDNGFPELAIGFCLEQGGLVAEDLDAVAYYEEPSSKLERIWLSIEAGGEARAVAFAGILARMNERGGVNPFSIISNKLGVSQSKIHSIFHHDSHRALAHFGSGFESARLLTIDGVGEFETTTLSDSNELGEDSRSSAEFPDSLGLFYAAITAFLGFQVNEAEYKVMGLASYGSPNYVDVLRTSLLPSPERQTTLGKYFTMGLDYYNSSPLSLLPYSPALLTLLGLPASDSDEYTDKILELKENPEKVPDIKRYADIARSAQVVLEEKVFEILEGEESKEIDTHCLAFGGGVALNCKLNQALMDKGYKIFVPPDPGDGGSAVGAAMAVYTEISGKSAVPFFMPYLGYETTKEEICATLAEFDSEVTFSCWEPSEMRKFVAEKIASGSIVGWYQGRSEFGPRALGNRSILADPRRIETQHHVNTAIKFREVFRPFAPSILDEYAEDYFELSEVNRYRNSTYYYMLSLANAKERAKKEHRIDHTE